MDRDSSSPRMLSDDNLGVRLYDGDDSSDSTSSASDDERTVELVSQETPVLSLTRWVPAPFEHRPLDGPPKIVLKERLSGVRHEECLNTPTDTF